MFPSFFLSTTVLLISLLFTIRTESSCDVTSSPSSWATIRAKNVFFNAWQPNNYLGNPSFCVNNDFFTHSLNYSSHVALADSSSQLGHDVATSNDLDSSKINCGESNKQVAWCQSHCQDKKLESLIIQSSVINGSLPLAVAQQIYEQLQSPVDLTIAALHIDQNSADIHVDYDYFNDQNFCSVYLKIKKSHSFPYVLLLTVQKVIV